jgi:glycosyltransferase involved in cell wall biosynthesis
MSAEVSILIPAYAAESFIDQTLSFARGQTYAHTRILVSVDQCEDTTFARVEAHAKADPRIAAFRQDARLGWAGNVNFLLDQVRTPYSFIYFHDDIIVPNYIETLLPVLEADPSAALVHCDVRYINTPNAVLPARENNRPQTERLLQFMLAPDRGAPLRGIVRHAVAGDVRLPNAAPHALYANEAFLLEVALRGALLVVPEVLYLNIANRPEGIVARWASASAAEARDGAVAALGQALTILDRAAGNEEEQEAYRFACFLWLKRFIDDAEWRAGEHLYRRPRDLHPALESARWPTPLDRYPADIRAWATTRWEHVAADLAARATE